MRAVKRHLIALAIFIAASTLLRFGFQIGGVSELDGASVWFGYLQGAIAMWLVQHVAMK